MSTDNPAPAILEPPTPDPHAIAPPPQGWETTREALHQLAEHEIAPARKAVDGRIRLRWLPGGFGTPRFGANRQIRVEGRWGGGPAGGGGGGAAAPRAAARPARPGSRAPSGSPRARARLAASRSRPSIPPRRAGSASSTPSS